MSVGPGNETSRSAEINKRVWLLTWWHGAGSKRGKFAFWMAAHIPCEILRRPVTNHGIKLVLMVLVEAV